LNGPLYPIKYRERPVWLSHLTDKSLISLYDRFYLHKLSTKSNLFAARARPFWAQLFFILGKMKEELHPEYQLTTISCTCGAVYETRSTAADLKVGICMSCHPFFTGEQRFVDTAGRVEKFTKRYGGTQARRRGGNAAAAEETEPAAEASA